jgi:tetratricopeptide (TPR) repeat protein
MAEAEDFWDRKRKSSFRFVTVLVYLCLLYAGVFPLVLYGSREKPFNFLALLLVFDAGLIVVTTVHELGHTLAAWFIGFRFIAFNVGPVTITKDQFGQRHYRFEWSRLTGLGCGYAAAVPVSEEGIRSKAAMMIFAGPFMSLNAGLLCWLIYLNLSSLGLEAYWGIPGILAILFVADFFVNLIPIGYSDGTMLLHLLLWTKHGRSLYAMNLSAKTHSDAAERLVRQDFAGEVELRQKALNQLLASGSPASLQLGHSYQALGYAQLNHWQRKQGAESLQRSLEVFGRCKDCDPIHVANSWKGLELIHRLRHNVEEARRASDSALEAFEKVSARSLDAASRASIASCIAELYADSHRFELGMREAERALAALSSSPKYLLQKSDLLRIKMRCHAGLGEMVLAREATVEAATILRSPDIADTERIRAASSMGNLAASAWSAGTGDDASGLLQEAIQRLEQAGGLTRAVGLRIFLTHFLRVERRLAEAEAALPAETDVDQAARKAFLDERAAIYLETNRIEEGLADSELTLRLVTDDDLDLAVVRTNLAEYLLADGKVIQAGELARQACDALLPLRHPVAAEALVTLALIGASDTAGALIDQAVDLVRSAPLLESGSRARALESITRRVERARQSDLTMVISIEKGALCPPQS